MLGCEGGHWVLGTPHSASSTLTLPPTTTDGLYPVKTYEAIVPTKIMFNATTPAECVALVRRDFPAANAAEYGNAGQGWCNAIFEAVGVIFDPMIQTCMFV